MTRTVDYRPLLAEPSPDAAARFRAEKQSLPGYANTGSPVFQSVAAGCAGLVVVGTVLLIGAALTAAAFALNPVAGGIVLVAGFVVGAGLVGLVVWGVVAMARRADRRWPRWFRLDAFARANGMIFSPSDANPAYPGVIFGIGSSRAAVDHLRSAADRYLDYGNYRFVTGDGKNSTTHTWGFLALELDRSLPHMVMDAKRNDGLFGSNLPASFDRSQVLSLEGDFDQWFTLYCPRQYERDALYVFTPDLMALLIDEAAAFDVEIIDRWMLVYSVTEFDMAHPWVHDRLLRIVDTVGRKTLTQTHRYVDERIGAFAPNVVAAPGQRLRQRVPVWVIVLLCILGGIVALPALALLIGAIVAVTGG